MNYIGKKTRRLDGKQKVRGEAVFGSDIKLDGLLYAACRHSDIVCGKIKSLDISKAEKMPGVAAIGLYDKIPGQTRVGPIRQDYLPLVKDEVFFMGDVIAVVAANTAREAAEAARAIEIDYEPYEPVTDPEEALKPETRLIHPEYKSNIVNHYPLRRGNIKIGFDLSDGILSRSFSTGFQEHAYIEPETITVEPDTLCGGLKIYGSIQNPYTTRKVVSLFMNLPLNRINVIPSVLGGSFGGKDDIINNIACRTALMCQLTGKPVQMTYTREESLKESYKRHPYKLDYKVGYTREGQIIAMQIKIIADSGAYSSQSFFVTWRSLVQATGPYEIPHVETDITAVYTNNCYTAAFRGFGSPQVIFAQETIIDEIARNCEISPRQVRLLNGLHQNSQTATGQILEKHTVSLDQVINSAAKAAEYEKQRENFATENETAGRYKKGIGMACSYRGCSLGAEGTDTSSAIVSVQADGSVILINGVTENGQGLSTTMSMIAADCLGIALDDIIHLPNQTSIIADGGPTVASRGTIAGGNAIINAAQKVKTALFDLLKEKLQADNPSEITWADGSITSKQGICISFRDAVSEAFQKGINLSAYGWFKAPPVSWSEEKGQGDAYFTYVYGCQIAEITVDTYTGKISVDKVWAAHDPGKVINLLGAEGQIYGGVVQGLGYACLENFNIRDGKVLSDNFDTYLIPTIQDIPQITPIFVENADKSGPFGAKSLGEPAFELIAAAINNALFQAVGHASTSLPLSLEQVFLQHNLNKPQRQSLQCKIPESASNSGKMDILTIVMNDIDDFFSGQDDDSQILAGGTDLMIKMRHNPQRYFLLDITRIPELKVIEERENFLYIGSTVTFSELISHETVSENFPLLEKACSLIGSTQIRNVATIGGNIVNAAPCADSIPPLIFYGASLILKTARNSREIKIEDFVRGAYETEIKNGELLTAIKLPLGTGKLPYHHYYQLGRRAAVNITRLSICFALNFEEDNRISACRIAAGSLLNKPALLPEIEDLITGRWVNKKLYRDLKLRIPQVLQKLIGKRWSSEYKVPVFTNLVSAALEDCYKKYCEMKNEIST